MTTLVSVPTVKRSIEIWPQLAEVFVGARVTMRSGESGEIRQVSVRPPRLPILHLDLGHRQTRVAGFDQIVSVGFENDQVRERALADFLNEKMAEYDRKAEEREEEKRRQEERYEKARLEVEKKRQHEQDRVAAVSRKRLKEEQAERELKQLENARNHFIDSRYDLVGDRNLDRMNWIRNIAYRIESGDLVHDLDLDYLRKLGQEGLVGHIWYARFSVSGDYWAAAKASGCWRRAHLSRKSIDCFVPVVGEEQYRNSGFAALMTSVGAAFRDNGELDSAERFANQAREIGVQIGEESYHPFNLLGALCLQTNRVGEGHYYFSRAMELGAKTMDVERDIRSALEALDDQQRERVATDLLARDKTRYGWIEHYAPYELPF